MTASQLAAAEKPAGRLDTATFTHRAVLLAAGIGFGLGILATVAFSPMISGLGANKHHPRALPTPVPFSSAQVYSKIQSLAGPILGRESNAGTLDGKMRLESVVVTPTSTFHYGSRLVNVPVYNAAIRFLLEPNTFGTNTQTAAAQSDCFQVFQSLYNNDLPLKNIDLYGRFQFPDAKRQVTVLHAGSDPSIELSLEPWQSLSVLGGDVSRVWKQLRPDWISRRFRKYNASGPNST